MHIFISVLQENAKRYPDLRLRRVGVLCEFHFGGLCLLERVDNYTRTEFWLKPSSLGWHNIARVGDVDELLHRHGVERKSHSHLAAINPARQLAKATNTAHKVDSFVGTKVFDSQNLVQYQVRQHGYVQHTDGVAVVVSSRLCGQALPLATQIHSEVVQCRGGVNIGTHLRNLEVCFQCFD